MASNSSEKYSELISFMQQKGFIWGPEPEIYGGLAGFYTYAPLGKLLKNNVESEIRKLYTKNGFWEVECPTVMQKEVWQASGHLGGFTDPVITCSKCKSNFRVDNLFKELFPDENWDHKSDEDYLNIISSRNVVCPSCKSAFIKEIKKHTLMMRTTIGLDVEAYNRPETATTTYLPFLRYNEFFRKKLPFSVFQIGKAYRNEISPRQHVIRCREFTQAEAQIFLFKNQKNYFEKYDLVKNNRLPLWTWQLQEKNSEQDNVDFMEIDFALKNGFLKNKAYAWAINLVYNLFKSIGIPEKNIRLRQHYPDEKAFYADDAWDLEVKLNTFGWTEMCGVHDRTNYDLTQHGSASGKELKSFNEESTETEKNEIPHIIEIAFGTDRPTFALLDLFYKKLDESAGKTKFLVPAHIAPVKVAVFPLMKKDGLAEFAEKIFEELQSEFSARYDSSGSIGKRYLREDESGTPYCITIDYDTIKSDSSNYGTVTIRDRDSETQKRIPVAKISETIRLLLSKKITFDSITSD